ncbi:uncharacterized protein K489DRAFT_384221 [Dissoconium aciculare CBS 342.82]|uniref:Uncharacterized protein n=1 Tax=Dissoconium aciculare CBS 342.82 TaxID=1314786 RepID=A0A6J3LU38_9PEZI|nr:uncharacterized protein K489DRAFT_384221 [Dissoconium aciculare CBS 342.82]KAF1819300.1 hypothetical protein K489DRAFT_384221 [Dissoconium aciculare CBS 342.82]
MYGKYLAHVVRSVLPRNESVACSALAGSYGLVFVAVVAGIVLMAVVLVEVVWYEAMLVEVAFANVPVELSQRWPQASPACLTCLT